MVSKAVKMIANVDNIKSWGIWLTALIRGCKLEPLTLSISGTTAPIFYIRCYMLGGKISRNLIELWKLYN